MVGGLYDYIAFYWLKPIRKAVLKKQFVRDDKGATAIEFGLIMLPFFGLILSIFSNAFLLMVDSGVDQAMATAARQIMLGAAQNNGKVTNAASFIDQLVCNPTTFTRVLPSYIDCSKIMVDMRVSVDFSSATPTTLADIFKNGSTKYCMGGPGDTVMASMMYPMPNYFPIFTGNWNDGNGGVSTNGLTMLNGVWVHMVISTSVFKNEPFSTTSSTSSGSSSGC